MSERPDAAASLPERIRRGFAGYTDAEQRVAHALLGEYPTAGLDTVAGLARRAGTSGPTILRFVARLGFASYASFQDAIKSEIQVRLQGPLSRYDESARRADGEDGDVYRRVADALRHCIDVIERDFPREDLARIVERLSDTERKVFCLGGRFSSMIAAYLHQYLRELRPGVRTIRGGNAAWADYLVDIGEGDVLVVFDFRRYQRDVLHFAKGAAGQGAEIVLVTDIWYSPISAFADVVVPCPVSIPSAFDSGIGGLAVAELVTAGVVERLGTRSRDRMTRLERLRAPFAPRS